MLSPRQKINDGKNDDNEIPIASATLKNQKIEMCRQKLEENRTQILLEKEKIAKLEIKLLKYEHLQQDAAIFFYNYTALLEKTLTDLKNLKPLQINRETDLLKKVTAFENDLIKQNQRIWIFSNLKVHESQGTEYVPNNPSVNGAPNELQGKDEEETIRALVAVNDKKFSDLQMRLLGNQITDASQIIKGSKLYQFYLNFRKDLKDLREKLIEYGSLVEEERQRLCLLKCLRLNREIIMMEEQEALKEQIKRREKIDQELQELLIQLNSNECEKLNNSDFHKLSLTE